jgi:hypothetical protein
MFDKDKVGKARMIGYGIGLAAFIIVAFWKFLAR